MILLPLPSLGSRARNAPRPLGETVDYRKLFVLQQIRWS
jgi:hypothetical protein